MSDFLRTVVAVVPAVLVGQLLGSHTGLGWWPQSSLVVGLGAFLGYVVDRLDPDWE
ncbi:hypothetical protein [Haloarchaeobius baliensis]|uniref:hypothetical protein n=1 Tax=Haloarchaeobius baliensis TaxID=1670458 RepID=UPI003F880BF2